MIEIAYDYRKTRYSSRRKGLLIIALKALGLIEYANLDGWKKNAFLCKECNTVHEKRSILVHYGSSNRHEEVYRTVLTLLDAWALDPKEPSGSIEELSREVLRPQVKQVSLKKETGNLIAAPEVDRKKNVREVIKK